MIENLESLVSLLDITLETRRKRHIVGGILLSFSVLFGGLAITAMTLKSEQEEDDDE